MSAISTIIRYNAAMEKLFLLGVSLARAMGLPLSDELAMRLNHVTRVGIVGLIAFLVQSSIFEVLGIQLGLLQASTAALLGGEIAVLTSFALNNHFNFHDRSSKPLWRRLITFHLVVSGSLFIQWALVSLAENYTSGTPMMLRGAFLLGVAIGFIFNYIGYHFVVWRR